MAKSVATYVHSDRSSFNKGGALVEVKAETDFATNTGQLISFANDVAKFAYASGKTTWAEIIEVFPQMEVARKEIEGLLKEEIEVGRVFVIPGNEPDPRRNETRTQGVRSAPKRGEV